MGKGIWIYRKMVSADTGNVERCCNYPKVFTQFNFEGPFNRCFELKWVKEVKEKSRVAETPCLLELQHQKYCCCEKSPSNITPHLSSLQDPSRLEDSTLTHHISKVPNR
jgi:hypothetical protein